ncbi:PLP-dependent aminotransferase family protein [Olsenella sp. AM30-3LB]|uniref:MocR-like pyridoxine biosynthesis transcription factor PdxR n=1 Tax=Olsenella sp. AM30-3LB TaxID=2292359 RepID=UPI000E4FA169|nr:PLP-dependent aminotransferase family protein [Olsenella sp. AM30-3LB]RHD76107.1 PLP-dependent aminotransferase family protein [Olsenella sp. AM30-3LB]
MQGIDLTGREELPLYEYLYRCIRDQVVAGQIAAGERLPSRRTLAERLGVSVVTVEGAYAQLVAEGYVVARSRRGYYAASLPSLPNAAAAMPVVAASAHAAKAGWEDKRAAGSVPYDLTRGANVASPGAARLWERALRDVLAHESDDVLYRTPPARGVPRLREAIAAHLARSRGMSVDPSLVVVGAGAQTLYGLVAQLLREGGSVGVEDPGYARASETYRAHGLDVRYLPLDGEGISVRALRGSDVVMAHVMPSHQFPTGRVMSVARRYELLGWAAEKDGRYVVEDDYDCELRLAGRPIPALASIDATGSVIYLNTFSKSLSSALRIAYLVLPASLDAASDERLGFLSTTVPAIDQVALAQALESGAYERHVARYRRDMREVRDALAEGLLDGPAGQRVRIEEADSGIHFVLAVEDDGRGEAGIAAAARETGVGLTPLSSFVRASEHAGTPDGLARFVVQYDGLSAGEASAAAKALGSVL